MTVAMYLADNKRKKIPKQWQHDPTLTNKYKCTVAMFFAHNGIIPPKEWQHDPNMKEYKN